MDLKEYKNIYKNEETHFYYVATHKLIINLIDKYLVTAKNQNTMVILDAGCGTGLLAKKLEKFGKVIGVDFSKEAIKFAKKRNVKTIYSSVDKMPFKNNTFDIITSVDVIYHEWVHNDQHALNEMFRILKPNGLLVLKVPAIKWLKLTHDKFVFTKRRYDKNGLKKIILNAGFKIEKLSYINFSLLIPATLKYFFEKIGGKDEPRSNVSKIPSAVNALIKLILGVEYNLVLLKDLPIGLGLVVVARKKE